MRGNPCCVALMYAKRELLSYLAMLTVAGSTPRVLSPPPLPERELLTQHTLVVTTLMHPEKQGTSSTHGFPLRLWLHLLPQVDMVYNIVHLAIF